MKFQNAREAREFANTYDGVEGVEVHGYDRFLYQFISENFPDEVDYRMDQMQIITIDIELHVRTDSLMQSCR